MNLAVAAPMLPCPYTLTRIRRETKDTFTLELHDPEGRRVSFSPGQFNMLYVFGVGEVAISISGDPAVADVLTHTTRAVGTVTKAMTKMKPGDTLGVRGPFGKGWPIAPAEGNDIVIVAGGIGLAPLRPVIYHVLQHRERYGKLVILYGTRTPQDILYRKEIEKWRGRFDAEVLVTVDRAVGRWHGHVGVVPRLIPRAPFDPYHTTAYVCGPEIMMVYALEALVKRGIGTDRIFVSMERNMKCAIGMCGHCQFGADFVCRDGPVFRYDRIARRFAIREV
jgi:NAD(P)H-flavin reductase